MRTYLKRRAEELKEAILHREVPWICPRCGKKHKKEHLVEEPPRRYCPHCGVFIDPLYCPECGGAHFLQGPRGGLAVNIKCGVCETEWWYAPLFGIRPIGE